jgi:uncharacterized protein (DUF885 family)
MGWLSAELWRARRLAVNVGLHAKGWSRQQAAIFSLKLSSPTPARHSPRMSLNKSSFACATKPNNAIASKCDIRDFRDTLFTHGAMPLNILEKQMRNDFR